MGKLILIYLSTHLCVRFMLNNIVIEFLLILDHCVDTGLSCQRYISDIFCMSLDQNGILFFVFPDKWTTKLVLQ